MKKDKPISSNKRKTIRVVCITVAIIAVLGVGLYQGYRFVRDIALEKMFVMMMDGESDTTSSAEQNQTGGETGEKMSIEDAAKAFERLNGVESEEDKESEKEDEPASDKKNDPNKKTDSTQQMTNEEKANQVVSQISEADKNRAIAIVSSVASVNDCINLYNLAMNGDQNAKNQLKAIYGRFSQAQLDELWSLYEKNKHLL